MIRHAIETDRTRGVAPGRTRGCARLAVLLLTVAACGSRDGDPAVALAPCDAAAPAVRVVWDRLEGSEPYPLPSDWFTRDDPSSPTGLRGNFVPGENAPAEHWLFRRFDFLVRDVNELDGWGTSAPGIVRFEGPLDLEASGGVPEVSTQPGRPQHHVFEGPRAPIAYVAVDPRPGRPLGERRGVIARQLDSGHLGVEPLRPLTPDTRWVLAITRELFAPAREGGTLPGCVLPSEAWTRALEGRAGHAGLEGLVNEGARSLAAVDPLYHRRNLVLALPFTTQTTVREMVEMRERLFAMPEPGIVPGSLSLQMRGGEGDPVAAELTGRFTAPDFRGPDRLWDPDPATGLVEMDGGELELDFRLRIPDHPGPVGLALHLHGLGGDYGEGDGQARDLAPLGYAVLTTSAVSHRIDPAWLRIPTFFNLFELALRRERPFSVVRDNFRQSTLDQLSLLRLGLRIARDGLPELEEAGLPGLDTTRPVGVVGMSLGGLMSSALVATAPEVDWAVSFVGGGSYARIITDGPVFSLLIPSFFLLLAPGEPVPPDLELVTRMALQSVLEKGDGVNFARHVVVDPLDDLLPGSSARNALYVEAIADLIVPNSSSEALMRALEIPLVEPLAYDITGMEHVAAPVQDNVAPGVTAAYAQYTQYRRRADGEPEPAGHGIYGVEPRSQFRTFVRSYLEGLPSGRGARIVDPFVEPDPG